MPSRLSTRLVLALASVALAQAVVWTVLTAVAAAQPTAPSDDRLRQSGADRGKATLPGEEEPPAAPAKVDVQPIASDEQIARRLERILNATPWFYEPDVKVEEGVAFLRGRTDSEDHRRWAGDLARSTQDVVAVVNLIQVTEPPLLDFGPALAGMRQLWRQSLMQLPWIVFGVIVFVLSYIGARLTRRILGVTLQRRITSPLLRGVAAWVGGAMVMILGAYVVLYVSGLTRLALTVLGGTGLVGLILGIGFRDITENFLASVFLSIQTPFQTGDLVEIDDVKGIVQRMTVRSTLLMSVDGNHIQIPNSLVYKSTIRNFTANPKLRLDFTVGIGYDVPVARAQDVALAVLKDHPAVLVDPESWVLAEALGSSSVVMRIYFWIDGHKHNGLKVRSALIRLVKRAFEDAGISMPDDAREIIFPQDVPVRLLQHDGQPTVAPRPVVHDAKVNGAAATASEGQLSSDTESLKEQAEQSRAPEEGENLLKADEN